MSHFSIRRAFLAAALGVVAWGAQAQSYPSRTITLIVPYTAGGPTDVAGRIMAQRLGERLGQAWWSPMCWGQVGWWALSRPAVRGLMATPCTSP